MVPNAKELDANVFEEHARKAILEIFAGNGGITGCGNR
jgi:hypothetical protein